jgi:mannose-6-phosphate isomerase-like protein (cupin superfamily)
MNKPIQPSIALPPQQRTDENQRIAAVGESFSVHEWKGSGPGYLHVHHADDEAWHVLEGTLRFRFKDKQVDAQAGTTVFVPAGVAHTYEAIDNTRYLIILTPRLNDLIAELHTQPDQSKHQEIMQKYQSEIVD